MMVSGVCEVVAWVPEEEWVWVWEYGVCGQVVCDVLVNEGVVYGALGYEVMVYDVLGCEV